MPYPGLRIGDRQTAFSHAGCTAAGIQADNFGLGQIPGFLAIRVCVRGVGGDANPGYVTYFHNSIRTALLSQLLTVT